MSLPSATRTLTCDTDLHAHELKGYLGDCFRKENERRCGHSMLHSLAPLRPTMRALCECIVVVVLVSGGLQPRAGRPWLFWTANR